MWTILEGVYHLLHLSLKFKPDFYPYVQLNDEFNRNMCLHLYLYYFNTGGNYLYK